MKLSELQSALGILRRNAAGCEVVNSAQGLKVRGVPAIREQELKALGAFREVSVDGSTALIKIAPEKALVHALRGKPAAVATLPDVKALTAELKEARAQLEALEAHASSSGAELEARLAAAERERDEARAMLAQVREVRATESVDSPSEESTLPEAGQASVSEDASGPVFSDMRPLHGTPVPGSNE